MKRHLYCNYRVSNADDFVDLESAKRSLLSLEHPIALDVSKRVIVREEKDQKDHKEYTPFEKNSFSDKTILDIICDITEHKYEYDPRRDIRVQLEECSDEISDRKVPFKEITVIDGFYRSENHTYYSSKQDYRANIIASKIMSPKLGKYYIEGELDNTLDFPYNDKVGETTVTDTSLEKSNNINVIIYNIIIGYVDENYVNYIDHKNLDKTNFHTMLTSMLNNVRHVTISQSKYTIEPKKCESFFSKNDYLIIEHKKSGVIDDYRLIGDTVSRKNYSIFIGEKEHKISLYDEDRIQYLDVDLMVITALGIIKLIKLGGYKSYSSGDFIKLPDKEVTPFVIVNSKYIIAIQYNIVYLINRRNGIIIDKYVYIHRSGYYRFRGNDELYNILENLDANGDIINNNLLDKSTSPLTHVYLFKFLTEDSFVLHIGNKGRFIFKVRDNKLVRHKKNDKMLRNSIMLGHTDNIVIYGLDPYITVTEESSKAGVDSRCNRGIFMYDIVKEKIIGKIEEYALYNSSHLLCGYGLLFSILQHNIYIYENYKLVLTIKNIPLDIDL